MDRALCAPEFLYRDGSDYLEAYRKGTADKL